MNHPLSPYTPLADIPFVVFDTETTGLNPRRDRMLSIGALSVRRWEIPLENCFEVLLHQDYEPASANMEVHELLPAVRAESLEEPEAVRQFLQYLDHAVVVGHHVKFDVAMINRALERSGAGKLRNPMLDTAQLARRLNPTAYFPEPGGYSLDRLCQTFNITPNDRHTASGDAFLTAVLFLKILGRLEKRGVRTLKDLSG